MSSLHILYVGIFLLSFSLNLIHNPLSITGALPIAAYTIDPKGSGAFIKATDGAPSDTATLVDFTEFNSQKAGLMAMGMHFPNPEGRTINGVAITTSVAQDLEPEYITTNNDTAFVTLQENNGVAVIDLTSLEVNVLGLGFKDWSALNIDAQEDGEVSFGKYAGLYGVYMPDTIAMYTWKEAPFLRPPPRVPPCSSFPPPSLFLAVFVI